MAKRYKNVTNIAVFPSDGGKMAYSNSNWTPYHNRQPATVILDENTKYHIGVFNNDNGSLGIAISEIVEYDHEDSLTGSISQGGFKKVAESLESNKSKVMDDDIPF